MGAARSPRPSPGKRPERWSVHAGDAGVANLVIPPDTHRERRFEVSCAMTVRVLPAESGAWHRLTLLADGSRQWQRQVDTSSLSATDGLDYRFERVVSPGQALRLTAEVVCQGAQRRSLVIEVEEVQA